MITVVLLASYNRSLEIKPRIADNTWKESGFRILDRISQLSTTWQVENLSHYIPIVSGRTGIKQKLKMAKKIIKIYLHCK